MDKINSNEMPYKLFPMIILLIFSGWILWGSICAGLFVLVSALAWVSTIFLYLGLGIISILIIIGIIFSIITIVSCYIGHEWISKIKTRYIWMKYFTVVARSVAKRINLDPEKVIQTYIAISNNFVLYELKESKAEKILILLPHCLQRNTCGLKLTTDIHNCKQCGACIISSLIDLSNKLNIDIFLASGGTLARHKIKSTLPDLIIAIACERDLLSGIRDTIPFKVIGIFNEKPEGPCINTHVNIDKIKDILLHIRYNTNTICENT